MIFSTESTAFTKKEKRTKKERKAATTTHSSLLTSTSLFISIRELNLVVPLSGSATPRPLHVSFGQFFGRFVLGIF